MLDKNIYLPQVKSIHIDFDYKLIHKALKKHKTDGLCDLNWPEAYKALYKETENKEIALKHIISCCEKALKESIIPFKNFCWNNVIRHSATKEI